MPCAEAVRRYEPEAEIIVVDDGIERGAKAALQIQYCAVVVQGDKPFIFSRNVNIGIAAARANDVVILNDDAILKTPGGFSILQSEAEEHPEIGIIAATTNNVGNKNQLNYGIGLRIDPRMVCFVAVLVPRRTIEKVGFLDEDFTGYGYDDDSYCLRVRRAGLKIGISDSCFVDHSSLKSTFRGDGYPSEAFEHNRRIFEKKYGASNDAL